MYAAIDAGNRNTKFYDGKQLIKFPSAIGINELQRNIKGERKPFDFEWEYEGKCGFAGTLAEDESEYADHITLDDVMEYAAGAVVRKTLKIANREEAKKPADPPDVVDYVTHRIGSGRRQVK